MKELELLAPAGSLKTLKAVIHILAEVCSAQEHMPIILTKKNY